MDVDSIVDSAVAQIMEQFEKEMEREEPKDEWESLGYEFGKGLTILMMPTIKEWLKTEVRESITSSIEEAKPGEAAPQKLLSTEGFSSLEKIRALKIIREGKVANVEIPSEETEIQIRLNS